MQRLKGMLEATMDVYTFLVKLGGMSFTRHATEGMLSQIPTWPVGDENTVVVFFFLMKWHQISSSANCGTSSLLHVFYVEFVLLLHFQGNSFVYIISKISPTLSSPPILSDFCCIHPPLQRSSIRGVPLLSLQGELLINPAADPLQNEDLVNMWLEVKIKPLIKSITKQFLSCLSTKNFSCSTYQTVYVYFCV